MHRNIAVLVAILGLISAPAFAEGGGGNGGETLPNVAASAAEGSVNAVPPGFISGSHTGTATSSDLGNHRATESTLAPYQPSPNMHYHGAGTAMHS